MKIVIVQCAQTLPPTSREEMEKRLSEKIGAPVVVLDRGMKLVYFGDGNFARSASPKDLNFLR